MARQQRPHRPLGVPPGPRATHQGDDAFSSTRVGADVLESPMADRPGDPSSPVDLRASRPRQWTSTTRSRSRRRSGSDDAPAPGCHVPYRRRTPRNRRHVRRYRPSSRWTEPTVRVTRVPLRNRSHGEASFSAAKDAEGGGTNFAPRRSGAARGRGLGRVGAGIPGVARAGVHCGHAAEPEVAKSAAARSMRAVREAA